jgi:hypothetical protein
MHVFWIIGSTTCASHSYELSLNWEYFSEIVVKLYICIPCHFCLLCLFIYFFNVYLDTTGLTVWELQFLLMKLLNFNFVIVLLNESLDLFQFRARGF